MDFLIDDLKRFIFMINDSLKIEFEQKQVRNYVCAIPVLTLQVHKCATNLLFYDVLLSLQ